jgi:hypothetical protein
MKNTCQVFALLSVLVIAGCSPLAGRTIEPPVSGTILFSDDFAKIPSGWGTWNRDGALVDYYAGGLRIQVSQLQHDYWSVAGKNFSDVQIEVDTAKLSGPDDNDFGILCRYQDPENFYALVISSDGYYGVTKRKDGEYSMIGSDPLQYSAAIVQGSAVNHLRVDCAGSTLSLYANGEKLMEAQDDDFSYGDVGLFAGSYDTPGIDIFFDNFVVKQP